MERFSVKVRHTLEIFSFRFLRCKAVHVYVLLLLDSMTLILPEHSSIVVLYRWLPLRSGTVFQSISDRFLTCLSIILYADDISLLAPSVTALQSLWDTCEDELYYVDMFINSSKTKSIRYGPRYKMFMRSILNMHTLLWYTVCVSYLS